MQPVNISQLLKELSELAESEISIGNFLNKVDNFNISSISQLSKACGNERHAKAILLKLSNVAIGKYQYLRSHSRLIAKPFGLIVDPCNACPLACPGCIHRKSTSDQSNIDWVAGYLGQDTLDQLLDKFGPYAINTQYFNWGEPLLNKNTPQYIQASRRFMMRTSISSNFSVLFCAEALVASGLDYLVISIDGATAETYNKYRVNGNFELVLSNIASLVEARRKLKSKTPYIVWQYLLFDHTLAEMDQAEKLARQLGVDRINFAAAYNVSEHETTITIPPLPPVTHRIFNVQTGAARQSIMSAIANLHSQIDELWEIPWLSQMDGEYTDSRETAACKWLYQDIVMDATGRIMPCCFDPMKDPTSIFGNIHREKNTFNTLQYINSREYFSKFAPPPNTACPSCAFKQSMPNINNGHIHSYFKFSDSGSCIQEYALKAISDW